MLPVVCMFLAGLYVGLGSFGIDIAMLVFSGSFPGKGGPPLPGGMPLGPCGREEEFEVTLDNESKEVRLSESSDLTVETGELCIDEAFEPRDSGLMSCVRSFANRALRSEPAGGIPLAAAVDVDTARPCSASGFGEGVGLIFCPAAPAGCPFIPCPFIWFCGADSARAWPFVLLLPPG